MIFLASGTGICVGGLTWLIKTYIFSENETQEAVQSKPVFTDVVGLPKSRLIPSAPLPDSNEVSNPTQPVQDAPVANSFQSNDTDVVGLPESRLIPSAPLPDSNEVSNPTQPVQDAPVANSFQSNDTDLNGEGEDLNGTDLSQGPDLSGQDLSQGPDLSQDPSVPDLSQSDVSQDLSGQDVSQGPSVPDLSGPDLSGPDLSQGPSVPSNLSGQDLSHGGSRKLFISKIKSRKRVNKCKYCKNT